MKEQSVFQAEYETKLNRVYLHLKADKEYQEDYQMPMLRQNPISGVLAAEGCSVDGKARYTYEVGGLTSMKTMHEKTPLTKQTIREVVSCLLAVTENLQEFLLNPNCLLLDPEYIFCQAGQWYFCYFPEAEVNLGKAFHQLTEYFVKTLDYGDTDGIFLAYELHKATMQEHYDLKQIMEEYEKHEAERKEAEEKETKERQEFGNIFMLTDEEQKRGEDGWHDGWASSVKPDILQEESGWWGTIKTSAKKLRGRRWGNWDDFILESDGGTEQEQCYTHGR